MLPVLEVVDGQAFGRLQVLPSPGLTDAPVLDLMCSHFVLTLAAKQGGKFNVRRDLNGLLSLAGRHLVWPHPRCSPAARVPGPALQRQRVLARPRGSWARAFWSATACGAAPMKKARCSSTWTNTPKTQPKDLLSVLTVTGEWLTSALKKHSTLVEKNIDALSGLLQLNKAERALLLYGTLARYQRDLRSILVEFKVNNAPEAYAAIADIAGVSAAEVGEALRAGSRLERIGLVENLISEHNITDLADLMKVSEKLPPVLMREYRDQSELMAVFTRPSAKSTLTLDDFSFVAGRRAACCARCCATRWRARSPASTCCCMARPAPARPSWPRWWRRPPGWSCSRWNTPTAMATRLSGRDRYRSLQIAQVFLKGSAQAALLFDEVEDVFPPISSEAAQLMARAEQVVAPGSGSVSGKAWVNQILEIQPVPTLWVTNRIEQIDPAFRRRFAYHLELKSPPPGAREQLVRKTLEGVAVSDSLWPS
jgi:hypothetical protein